MKIRMNEDIVSEKLYAPAGSIVDLPAAQANRLVKRGSAEKVEGPKKTETAIALDVETATNK